MFQEHNGHHLAILEEVVEVVRQNIADLRLLIEGTQAINEDSKAHLET